MEDMPRVDDPELRRKLEAPLALLHATAVEAGGVGATIADVPPLADAPWSQRGARKRKSRSAKPNTDKYRQHVDVFYAFHDSTYKPSARSFNVAREDIDHFLKHGSFLWGEWFTGGQRCPGGDRSEPLPEGLSERPSTPPDFPEYEMALEPTDGAPTQFANATNHHQMASWRTKTGIIRRHAKALLPRYCV